MSKHPEANTQTLSANTSGESAVPTPASTSSSGSQRSKSVPLTSLRTIHTGAEMEDSKDQTATDRQEQEDPPAAGDNHGNEEEKSKLDSKKKSKCKKHEHKESKHVKRSKGKHARKDQSESESESGDETEESESSGSSSAEEMPKKKKSSKVKQSKKTKGKKDRRNGKKTLDESTSGESEESEDGDSDEEDGEASGNATTGASVKLLEQQLAELKRQVTGGQKPKSKRSRPKPKQARAKTKASKQSFSTQYKRVDQLWDTSIHNYKLKESAEDDESEFAEFAFLVRRTFDWENKYRDTVVDIKSKQLKTAMIEVMKDCKSVSLEAEEPTVDPNILFLYLEELRTHYKKTLKAKIKAEKKRKVAKKLEQQRSLLKTLVSYIDEDYADTKKTLYPLIKAGNITFDLLWALFHPNDIAVTSCYGVWDEPRCFKVEYANKCQSMTRGEWYCIEGKYLEYDGKGFGFGDFEVDVEGFKGPRKITSLSTYPLKYHKDPEKVKKQIVERGERFVNMEGMHYKFHKGLAFMKRKKQILRFNINGRVMLDPATFRRINPNYPISWIKPKEDEDLFSDSDDDSDSEGCSCGDSEDEDSSSGQKELDNQFDEDRSPKYKYKWTTDEDGDPCFVAVEVDEDGQPIRPQRVDRLAEHPDLKTRSFTEEEMLLTSPVILGFAFSEKLWLEFTISGVHDITYNEDAFDSLVLPPNQKSIVRALVESHKLHAAKAIDDVVQGKGKGLVAVLHGPPGTGKTLTAEGISELLQCPLYMVSAGELGTDPARLEHELQKILDIAHSWGAVLLLDEADVFLEKREVHDIHRNALVSIFLRLLEYFQGILFLTTNRVETFDDAFQSRIHVALRYGELTTKAKKAVWKMFLELVKKVEGMEVEDFSDYQLDVLSRNQLNGRQIKNLVRTAQALALNEKQKLTMEHIKRVIDVAETFDRDLKGGTGYIDAMRSYT